MDKTKMILGEYPIKENEGNLVFYLIDFVDELLDDAVAIVEQISELEENEGKAKQTESEKPDNEIKICFLFDR